MKPVFAVGLDAGIVGDKTSSFCSCVSVGVDEADEDSSELLELLVKFRQISTPIMIKIMTIIATTNPLLVFLLGLVGGLSPPEYSSRLYSSINLLFKFSISILYLPVTSIYVQSDNSLSLMTDEECPKVIVLFDCMNLQHIPKYF